MDVGAPRAFRGTGGDLSSDDEFDLRADGAWVFARSSDHSPADQRIFAVRNRGDRYLTGATMCVAGLGYGDRRIFTPRGEHCADRQGASESNRLALTKTDSGRR